MIIALGSQSQVKQQAVQQAIGQYRLNAQLQAVKARSGVAEQPFDGETLVGACNRAVHAAELVPGAALAIAIESGLFYRHGRYYDVAVVVARLADGEFLQVESEAVEFPADAVEEVRRRGTDVWTVGKILQEDGRVQFHDDPHLTLVGKSRTQFVNEAVLQLFEQLQRSIAKKEMQHVV